MLRRLSLTVFALTLVGAPRITCAQRTFTIDQVMSAPFAEELVGSKSGNAVAWVVDTRGARNV